jgi:peroxin-14
MHAPKFQGYNVAPLISIQRYIYPIIAPPTAPQLEQDKQAIDESFEKAFSLLDQLAKDTEALKESEQSRTEKLDQVLVDVENALTEFKGHSERREQDTRRINDEVRGLKDLIPKALEGQKESTDNRLKELNTELKSLKTLMGQRMNPPATSSPSPYNRTTAAGSPTPTSTTPGNAVGSSSSGPASPKPASVAGRGGIESVAALHDRTTSTFNSGTPAIPAWQMAAANKSSTSANTSAAGSSSQEAADGA